MLVVYRRLGQVTTQQGVYSTAGCWVEEGRCEMRPGRGTAAKHGKVCGGRRSRRREHQGKGPTTGRSLEGNRGSKRDVNPRVTGPSKAMGEDDFISGTMGSPGEF